MRTSVQYHKEIGKCWVSCVCFIGRQFFLSLYIYKSLYIYIYAICLIQTSPMLHLYRSYLFDLHNNPIYIANQLIVFYKTCNTNWMKWVNNMRERNAIWINPFSANSKKYTNTHCTKKWSFPLRISSVIDQIRGKLRNWSHLLKKSLMENFIFCAMTLKQFVNFCLVFAWKVELNCNWLYIRDVLNY